MNTPVFLVDISSDGQFFFVLKAGNGEVIATSEMYTTKQACLHGIDSVIACSIRAEIKIKENFNPVKNESK